MKQKEHAYRVALNWFVVFSVTMVFGVIWTILGDSHMKIFFVGAAFALFIKSAVEFEMSSRELHGAH
jgi:hypothetical protein